MLASYFLTNTWDNLKTLLKLWMLKNCTYEFRDSLVPLCTATKDAVLLCPQRKRGWQKLEALHQNYDGGDASFTQWFRKWDLQLPRYFSTGVLTHFFRPIFSNLEIYLKLGNCQQGHRNEPVTGSSHFLFLLRDCKLFFHINSIFYLPIHQVLDCNRVLEFAKLF